MSVTGTVDESGADAEAPLPLGSSLLKAVAGTFVAAILFGLLLRGIVADLTSLIDNVIFFAIALLGSFAVGALVFLRDRRALAKDKRNAQRDAASAEPWERVVFRLEDRIDELNQATKAIYWTILGVIVAGVLLVIFAGDLASLDSRTSSLSKSLSEETERIQAAQRQLVSDFYRDARFPGSEENSGSAAALREYEALKARANQRLDGIQEDRRALFRATLDNIMSNSGGGSDLNLSGMILRACIIGLLIFLVQILVQLYRYNSRLIAFYSSRRDGLQISGGDPARLKVLMPILAPVGFDFGRQPTHPLQEISALVGSRLGGAGQTQRSSPPAQG